MAKSNVAAEPSMEEILASIRRIIADEDPGQAAKGAEFISEPLPDDQDDYGPAAAAEDDVLDLGSEEEAIPEAIPPQAITPIDMEDVSFDALEAQSSPSPAPAKQNDWNEPAPKPAPQMRAPMPPPQPQPQYT